MKAVLFVFALLMIAMVVISTPAVQAAPGQPVCPPTPTPTPTPTALPPPTGDPLDPPTDGPIAPHMGQPHALPSGLQSIYFTDGPIVYEYSSEGGPWVFVPRQYGFVASDIIVPMTFTATKVEVMVDITTMRPGAMSIYLAHNGRMDLVAFHPASIPEGWITLDIPPLDVEGIWTLAVIYNWDEGALSGWAMRLTE